MAGAAWKLTIRHGPKVTKSVHASLQAGVDGLRGGLAAARDEQRAPLKVLSREYDPVAQVIARGELRGPGGRRGGVDVRGDGSAEAWTGGWRRAVVLAEPGETPYDAVLRALS